MPLLGVLPNLPDDLSDPRQAMLAGFCVHHIRTLMQLGDEGLPRQVFVVTGPSGGSGKTSLTLSLGISFASSGAKTLLVDSDVVGGGLTRRLEAIIRRRIGQLLLQNGLLTQEQLEHGLHIARERGVMLGEALVSLGILEKSDLEHVLTLQETATIGLLDAVHGEPLDHCLAGTSIPGLEILPIGGARLADASSISPTAMARVMQEARRQFDVILIDTGPVPGSIESAIACSQADRVAVVVSRGDQRQDAQRSMKFLHSIAAPICGVVFNRATVADSASSSYSASVNRGDPVVATVPNDSNGKSSEDSALSRRFGPVAHAVTRVSRRR
jgi:Mrp family chromosome partitioning ATPase